MTFYGNESGGTTANLHRRETTLAFASHALRKMNFPAGYVATSESSNPLGLKVTLVTPTSQRHRDTVIYP
ncbi:MAG: hypothetical protein ABL863_08965 [Nitrosomonas sp.]